MAEPPCDLALLDINLPGENGFEICRRLRETSDVPVIFLTARTSAEDEILGFGMGADDYIRKPYHSTVLLARIARLLKRKSSTVLTVRELTLNLPDLTVSYHGRVQELTRNETRILACLMKKELCTREEIIEDLWQNSLYIDENTLYVNVNRLRDKLKGIGAEGFLRNVRRQVGNYLIYFVTVFTVITEKHIFRRRSVQITRFSPISIFIWWFPMRWWWTWKWK